MLSKALLFSGLFLLFAKFVLRLKFRELARRIDRGVTVLLVLIAVSYGAHVAYYVLSAR